MAKGRCSGTRERAARALGRGRGLRSIVLALNARAPAREPGPVREPFRLRSSDVQQRPRHRAAAGRKPAEVDPAAEMVVIVSLGDSSRSPTPPAGAAGRPIGA